MSGANKKNIVYFLLLLYLGYFAAVSYYIHPHTYRGIIYIHSHPYEKDTNQAKDRQFPFEANHKHNAASFSTINQLSNLLSLEQGANPILDIIFFLLGIYAVFYVSRRHFSSKKIYFSLRAPPSLGLSNLYILSK